MKTNYFKKGFIGILLLGSILLIVGCSSSSSTEEASDTITLKVADSVPKTNFISTDGITYWMDRVEELTDGKVEFEYYPSEQLGEASSLLDATKSKTTDIGYVSYADEDLPLTQITKLPGAIDSASEGGEVLWELVNEDIMLDTFLDNNVRPVFAATLTPDQMTSNGTKISEKDDFKGLKIRSAGGISDITSKTMGVTPVSMAAPEMYTAIDRGTVDGALVNLTSFKPYQLEKVSEYSTKNANFGSFGVYYAINEDVYQGLDDDIKDALMQAGDDTVEHFGAVLDESVEELTDEFNAEGVEMYDLDSELKDSLDEEFRKYWSEWAENLDDKGQPAGELLEEFESKLQ